MYKLRSCEVANATITAIQALEEIQKYKAIGTVEDINKVLSFLGDENKRSIIDDLKLLNEYKEAGTVEDFKALKLKEDIFDRNIKNCKEIGLAIRLMAIYEFAERLKCKIDLKSLAEDTYGCVSAREIDEIAEQMKVGDK